MKEHLVGTLLFSATCSSGTRVGLAANPPLRFCSSPPCKIRRRSPASLNRRPQLSRERVSRLPLSAALEYARNGRAAKFHGNYPGNSANLGPLAARSGAAPQPELGDSASGRLSASIVRAPLSRSRHLSVPGASPDYTAIRCGGSRVAI